MMAHLPTFAQRKKGDKLAADRGPTPFHDAPERDAMMKSPMPRRMPTRMPPRGMGRKMGGR